MINHLQMNTNLYLSKRRYSSWGRSKTMSLYRLHSTGSTLTRLPYHVCKRVSKPQISRVSSLASGMRRRISTQTAACLWPLMFGKLGPSQSHLDSSCSTETRGASTKRRERLSGESSSKIRAQRSPRPRGTITTTTTCSHSWIALACRSAVS